MAAFTCSDCSAPRVGRRKRCPECQRGHDRRRLAEWRRANPDKYQAQWKRHNDSAYARDPEKVKRRVKVWVEENRDRANAYARGWRARNPEKHRASAARVRRANPERYLEATRRRQALKLAATVEKVDYRMVVERDRGECQLCGTPVDFDAPGRSRWAPSIDHIVPLSRGGEHSYANVQLAHFGCNSRKGNRVAA